METFYIASRFRREISEDWLNSNYSNVKKEVGYIGIFGPFTLEEAVAKYYNGFFDDCDYGIFMLKDKHWNRIR